MNSMLAENDRAAPARVLLRIQASGCSRQAQSDGQDAPREGIYLRPLCVAPVVNTRLHCVAESRLGHLYDKVSGPHIRDGHSD